MRIWLTMATAGTVCLLAGLAMGAEADALLPPADMAFLEGLAQAVLEESRVAPGARVGGIGPNTTGGPLIRPGGRNAYPAFWIRDYAMSLEAGGITLEEQRHMLFLTAAHQPDETVTLPTGSVLPPGSIADHIAFGGAPIYFPGILEDYEKQGGPRWGKLPSLDDHFFFVHMAAEYARQSDGHGFLAEKVHGKPLLQRLEEAYVMPPAHAESGIVYTTEAARGVNFGFYDTTVHTGDLFFCSVLKYRAARELASLFAATDDGVNAGAYRSRALALQAAFEKTFAMDTGFFSASTGLSGQTDVWGTAFAVYVDALSPARKRAASEALADALRRGVIVWDGAIRHVPTDGDFNASTAWEKSFAAKNRYQNGAYWDTPVGWVCYAVAQVDFPLAEELARGYVAQLREDDFRKGPEHGAPWECRHAEGNHRQNPVYLTSVACPLAAFRRIDQSRSGILPLGQK